MLKSYSIDGFRAIKHATIDFGKGKVDYRQKYLLSNQIINPCVIYGNNGTGKSLTLVPFGILTYLLNYEPKTLPSILLSLPDMITLMENKDLEAIPQFCFTFSIDNCMYEYKLSILGNIIYKETLKSDDVLLFSRKKNSYTLNNTTFDVSDGYPALRKIGIEEYGNTDTIKPLIKKAYDYLSSIVFIDSEGNVYGKEFRESSFWDIMSKNKEGVEKHINNILSIPKFKIAKEKDKSQERIYLKFNDDQKKLPIELASDGMVETLRLVTALESCCTKQTRLVVVDELDKSLHPLALKKTVDSFIDQNIQLICSTHDTNLMRYLRPDQIYLTYFNNTLHSTIHRLNDIYPRIREINSIEKMYLNGVFDEAISNAKQ